MTTYRLPKEYIYLCIFGLIFVLTSLYWEPNIFSLIFLIIICIIWIGTPYRIDCDHKDSIIVHRIIGKKQIKFKDIKNVTKGNFRDKVEIKDGCIYLTHLISNLDQLTNEIVKTINTHEPEKNGLKNDINKHRLYFDGPIRVFFILLISIAGPILFIIYLIKYLKHF